MHSTLGNASWVFDYVMMVYAMPDSRLYYHVTFYYGTHRTLYIYHGPQGQSKDPFQMGLHACMGPQKRAWAHCGRLWL